MTVDITDYQDLVDVAKKAKELGLACVIVFKPDCREDEGTSESADMVISSADDPQVIAALLGNLVYEYKDEEEEEGEEEQS